MCCFKIFKKKIENFKEKHQTQISTALILIEIVQTSFAIYLGISGIKKWAKFIKVDFEKNGYYYFIKGINQSKVNLNSCSIFSSDESTDYFEDLCIKRKYLISLQFWSSIIILLFFQFLDLIVAYRKRRDRKIEVGQYKKSLIKDIGSLRYILKFFFIPGVFIIILNINIIDTF